MPIFIITRTFETSVSAGNLAEAERIARDLPIGLFDQVYHDAHPIEEVGI